MSPSSDESPAPQLIESSTPSAGASDSVAPPSTAHPADSSLDSPPTSSFSDAEVPLLIGLKRRFYRRPLFIVMVIFVAGLVGVGIWFWRDEFYRNYLLATLGNTRARYVMGAYYKSGERVPQSYQEAAKWFKRAADAGHPESQFEYSVLRLYGNGVEKDEADALVYLEKAASNEIVEAQFLAGGLLLGGLSEDPVVELRSQAPGRVTRIYRSVREVVRAGEALIAVDSAGTESNITAPQHGTIIEVGVETGEAVTIYTPLCRLRPRSASRQQGEFWLIRAAQNRYAPAEYYLANLYMAGDMLPKDHVKAWVLLNDLAERGSEDAMEQRDRLETTILTPEELKKVKALQAAATPSTPEVAAARQTLADRPIDASGEDGLSVHERIVKDSLAMTNEFVEILKSATDGASARAAVGKLKILVMDTEALRRRIRAAGLPTPQLEREFAKYRQQLEDVNELLMQELRRIDNDPNLAPLKDYVGRAMKYMQEMNLVD